VRRALWSAGPLAIGVVTVLGALASAPPAGAVAAGTVASGAPVISVTSTQSDGSIWVLSKHGTAKKISKVDATSGTVLHSESVSPQASAIAQSPNGNLVLGTAHGTASAVVLYNGTTGGYLGTVPVTAPVSSIAISPNGQIVYVLDGSGTARTLFTFNATHTGFSYNEPADTVGLAPTPDGSAIWTLRFGGGLSEMGFFPKRSITQIQATFPAQSSAISPDGQFLYVLGVANSSGLQQVKRFALGGGSSATYSVPAHSVDIAVSADGSTLYDAVAGKKTGKVAEISSNA
jgi:WD40 repeat protein